MLILNDVHLGVQRSAGTTPASAMQLRQWLQASFRNFIRNMNEPLIINGDLFDSFSADNVDVLDCFHTLSTFAERNALYLVAGNHDLAKDSNKLSSFEWLASVLRTIHPNNVFTIMSPTWLRSRGIYVIPHLVNQQALDEAIACLLETVVPEATACGNMIKFCLFHANYDNHFAAQADHSLNVNQEQAMTLIAAGVMPVFGHEHPKRVVDLGDGDVLCTGNQWPSSISDCIGSKGKFAHRLLPSGNYESIQTWEPDGVAGYVEVDWRDLDQPIADTTSFVRVTGESTFETAAEVVSAVSRLRQRSDAFVVTNAVKVAGAGDELELAENAQVSQKLDVVNLLLEVLDEKEAARVKEVLNDQ